MKLLRSSLAILTAGVLSANAQTTVATDPVGFTSFTVNANSDQKLGVPMQQSSAFQGQASLVSGTTVEATGITALAGSYFLVATSGTANGQWEEIASFSAGSVTLAAAITGFTTGDSFDIKPFWTLGTLFPGGGAVPASPDVFDPRASVLVNNPAATGVNIPASGSYLYHGGSVDYVAGWYDANAPDSGLKNNVVLSPEVALAIRNNTASAVSVSFVGSVPASKFGLDVVRSASGPQDNLVYNKFPADVTLGNSDLADGAVSPSADVFDPGDQVLLYALNNSGYNPAASSAYFYHGGSVDYVEGWYDSSAPDSGLKNSTVIPAGSQVVIRKVQGTASTVLWNPVTPYNLQ